MIVEILCLSFSIRRFSGACFDTLMDSFINCL